MQRQFSNYKSMQNVNGQKSTVVPRNSVIVRDSSQVQVSQHDDLIQFMFESWNKVVCDIQANGQERSNATYYSEEEVNSQLKDFVPVDLEALKSRQPIHHNLSQHV